MPRKKPAPATGAPTPLPGQLDLPIVARRRRGRPTNEAGQLRTRLTLKGTDAWEAWLADFAGQSGLSRTVLVDRALADLAERLGFRVPPERTK